MQTEEQENITVSVKGCLRWLLSHTIVIHKCMVCLLNVAKPHLLQLTKIGI